MYEKEIREFLEEQGIMDASTGFYNSTKRRLTTYILPSAFLLLFIKFLRRKSLLK